MISSAHTKNNWIPVGIALLLGAFLIFYKFCIVPQFLTFDEIEFAKLALSLFGKPYIPYSPLATGHSTLYFYILLFSLKVFGISSLSLRLPSAIFGITTLVLIYFVLRKALQKIKWIHSPILIQALSVGGLFMLGTTRWFYNFARFGFEATFLLTLELASLLFFLHYLDHKQKKWLVGSGLLAGLAYNSYQPGRLFFSIILFALFLFILERKNNRLDFSFFSKKTILMFFTFLIPFVICITPLTLYLSQNPDVRVNQLFYPANTELSASDKLSFFGRNLASSTLMFSVKGDVNGRHNYPNKAALNPIISIFFVLGIFFALKDIKSKVNQTVLLYFLVSVVPTLFTYPWENPNMLRTFTVLPSIIYFSLYAFGTLYRFGEQRLRIQSRALIILMFVLLSVSALYDVRTYFLYQAPVFKEAFEAHMPLQYYLDHPDAKIKR